MNLAQMRAILKKYGYPLSEMIEISSNGSIISIGTAIKT